jgi:hypothetical protein
MTRRPRPRTVAAISAAPTVSAMAGVSLGLPWPAAFTLAALGLISGAVLALYAERHRHDEYLATIGKVRSVEPMNIDHALHLLRGSPGESSLATSALSPTSRAGQSGSARRPAACDGSQTVGRLTS